MVDYSEIKSGLALSKVRNVLLLFAWLILLFYCECDFGYAGLPVYFIEPHHPSKFFWRGTVYGEHDDFRRFSYFSRAALELLLQAGKKPDIIHCHDWQTAFVVWTIHIFIIDLCFLSLDINCFHFNSFSLLFL